MLRTPTSTQGSTEAFARPKRSLHSGARAALQLGIGVTLVATAVMIIWHWPYAWIPAIMLGITVSVYLVSRSIDWHAHHDPMLPPLPAKARRETVAAGEGKVAFKVMATIGIALAAIAVILATTAFESPVIGLGALAFMALLLFFGLPVWIAAVQEESSVETYRLEGRPDETRSGTT